MTDTGPQDIVDPSAAPTNADTAEASATLDDMNQRLANLEQTVAGLVEDQVQDDDFDDDEPDMGGGGIGAAPTTSDGLGNDLGPDDDDDEIDLLAL